MSMQRKVTGSPDAAGGDGAASTRSVGELLSACESSSDDDGLALEDAGIGAPDSWFNAEGPEIPSAGAGDEPELGAGYVDGDGAAARAPAAHGTRKRPRPAGHALAVSPSRGPEQRRRRQSGRAASAPSSWLFPELGEETAEEDSPAAEEEEEAEAGVEESDDSPGDDLALTDGDESEGGSAAGGEAAFDLHAVATQRPYVERHTGVVRDFHDQAARGISLRRILAVRVLWRTRDDLRLAGHQNAYKAFAAHGGCAPATEGARRTVEYLALWHGRGPMGATWELRASLRETSWCGLPLRGQGVFDAFVRRHGKDPIGERQATVSPSDAGAAPLGAICDAGGGCSVVWVEWGPSKLWESMHVERVLASSKMALLCKWRGMETDESTWERRVTLKRLRGASAGAASHLDADVSSAETALSAAPTAGTGSPQRAGAVAASAGHPAVAAWLAALREYSSALAAPHSGAQVASARKALQESASRAVGAASEGAGTVQGSHTAWAEQWAPSEETAGDKSLALRDYQVDGVRWALRQWATSRSCLLADEMGLGKTVQAVVAVRAVLHRATLPAGPALVVVPLATLPAWDTAFADWAPDLAVATVQGSALSRRIARRYEMGGFGLPALSEEAPGADPRGAVDVVLATYESLRADEGVLACMPWQAVVVDEAHRSKNAATRTFRDLHALPTAWRLLLTGTPLQNSLSELWALLRLMDPAAFQDVDAFLGRFSALDSAEGEGGAGGEGGEVAARVGALESVLQRYMLRRVKAEVLPLPPKCHTVVPLPMAGLQLRMYHMVLARDLSDLHSALAASGAAPAASVSLRNVAVQLQKCCNHPFLVSPEAETLAMRLYGHGDEDQGEQQQQQQQQQQAEGSGTRMSALDSDPALRALVLSSGKLAFLDSLLRAKLPTGHRFLVFSQMTSVLALLRRYLTLVGLRYQHLQGSTPSASRKSAIASFNDPASSDSVFLLSTRAGGLGINLATADVVVLFDSDWNPHNDLQAESRAHRHGQTKPVSVYRLLCAGSVEQKVLERAQRKLDLGRLAGQQGANDGASSSAMASVLAQSAAATLGESADSEAPLDTRAAAADRALARLDAESVLAKEAYRDRVLDVADAEESGVVEGAPPGQDRGLASLLLSYTAKASRRRSQRAEGRSRSAQGGGDEEAASLRGLDTAKAREHARRMEEELASASAAGGAAGAHRESRGAGASSQSNGTGSRDSAAGAAAARPGTVVSLRVGGSSNGTRAKARAQIPDAVLHDGLSVTQNPRVAACISALRRVGTEASAALVARKAEELLAELRDSIRGWCSLRHRPAIEAWREVARALRRPVEPLMDAASKAGVLEG